MIYCTGGIRCDVYGTYLRKKGWGAGGTASVLPGLPRCGCIATAGPRNRLQACKPRLESLAAPGTGSSVEGMPCRG
jgi:hypothetical protein